MTCIPEASYHKGLPTGASGHGGAAQGCEDCGRPSATGLPRKLGQVAHSFYSNHGENKAGNDPTSEQSLRTLSKMNKHRPFFSATSPFCGLLQSPSVLTTLCTGQGHLAGEEWGGQGGPFT